MYLSKFGCYNTLCALQSHRGAAFVYLVIRPVCSAITDCERMIISMPNNANFNLNKANDILKHLNINKQLKRLKARDAGVAAAFIGAIAILLFVAGYVIMRLAGERAYRAKWNDYNDCGWA